MRENPAENLACILGAWFSNPDKRERERKREREKKRERERERERQSERREKAGPA